MKKEIHFAPLQGLTDYIFRNAHMETFGNIDKYYTPFVRLETQNSFRNKDINDIKNENNDTEKVIPQLIASSAAEAEPIVKLFIENGYRHIDINMGCPFPLITKKNKGAGILSHPELIEDLLSITEKYQDIDFSVKMRLGMNDAEEWKDLIDTLNKCRLTHITMHPRIGKQQYKGEVNLEEFDKFYNNINKPVIYNGDIATLEDIERISSLFPQIKGIMIGRGLIAQPWLAMEYKADLRLDSREKLEMLTQLHNRIFEQCESRFQGESQILSHLQPYWEYLHPELDKKTRKKICKCTKLKNYTEAVCEALR